jgi:hypothetical protein
MPSKKQRAKRKRPKPVADEPSETDLEYVFIEKNDAIPGSSP